MCCDGSTSSIVGWEISHELPRWPGFIKTFACISPHWRALMIKDIFGVISSGHEVVLVWSKISVVSTLDVKVCAKTDAGCRASSTNGCALSTGCCISTGDVGGSCSKGFRFIIIVDVDVDGSTIVLVLIDLVHVGFFRERCGLGLDVTKLARNQILSVMIGLPRGDPGVVNVVHSPDGEVTSRGAHSASPVGSTTTQQPSGLIFVTLAINKGEAGEGGRVVARWHRCDVVGCYDGLVGREGRLDLVLQTTRISPGAIVRVSGVKVGNFVVG